MTVACHITRRDGSVSRILLAEVEQHQTKSKRYQRLQLKVKHGLHGIV